MIWYISCEFSIVLIQFKKKIRPWLQMTVLYYIRLFWLLEKRVYDCLAWVNFLNTFSSCLRNSRCVNVAVNVVDKRIWAFWKKAMDISKSVERFLLQGTPEIFLLFSYHVRIKTENNCLFPSLERVLAWHATNTTVKINVHNISKNDLTLL